MSLLEDIFLEDEAAEAQDLERVIEGDEFDERPRSRSDSDDNSEKEDEAVEEKQRVDPTKAKQRRVVKNPRFVLNPARLTGPRGIACIPEYFKDFKFKGKGHEKEDLDLILKKLEHWAYRLYPKFKFEDCLKKIEALGKKRSVMVHLHKIRSGQLATEETVVQKDSSDEEAPAQEEDEFDKLLQQQIELAHATPAPDSVKKGFMTPSIDKRSPHLLSAPKATASPSISDEQRERIMRNRRLAEERRLARLKNNTLNISTNSNTEASTTIDLTSVDKSVDNQNNTQNDKGTRIKKTKKSFVIDSDDDDVSNSVNPPLEHHSIENKDDCNVTETSQIGNFTNINSQNNIVAQNEVTDLVDITKGYEFRNNKSNHKINEVIDLVNTEVQDSNIIIGNNDSNSSDDECDLNSVNISITADVHKGDNKNSDIEENDNKGILEKSKEISKDFGEKELSENKNNSVKVFLNETGISQENVHAIEENTNFQNENVSNVNEFDTIDKENIDSNIAQSLGLDDLMDIDFSNDF
ncbi:TIMELESS-interacting protein [Hyposmocoma kahamanoa]|uniref:TIMELESS-interacting protein n=1 Tax=Hyposmocoma kahamanoa TaxID=1477025 RepID=UPI000E6D6066|nr:TIMELESS-interacting protein [Hyposmocoma kahamanoa]